MRHSPLFIILLLTVLCFAAPWIESLRGINSNEADLALRFLPPSAQHWLGTDELGRDVFLRLLYGGQVSLGVALLAAMAAGSIGTMVGMLAGYAGGRTDALLMRLTDLLIALPALPLLIILAALDLEKLGISAEAAQAKYASLYKISILIALLGWTTLARLARARTLVLRQSDFVRAARALGVTHARILARHILPNILNTVSVAVTLAVGHIILMESVLSFLGLGIQPPLPSWGNMLTHAEDYIWENARLMIYPGLLIFTAVLCFNFMGDQLQDRLDPRSINRKPAPRS
ncbi:MAG: ABC transporter permease [Bdellovibrionales bacterium]|jgi:peptide/nickel transport system permease protein|nr:ABC transporter permease [Bdellovibrionales bacterium]